MFEGVLKEIMEDSKLCKADVCMMNPLVLAYVGDAVFELFIRTVVLGENPNKSVRELHLMSTGHVKAHAQSEAVKKLTSMLTDEEMNIVRRGRNSKSGTVPKNADVCEYRMATGFEALIGYLYLTGSNERLKEILKHTF